MPGQYGNPIRGSNPWGRPDVINSIRPPQNPAGRPRPPMPGMPPVTQRPISSIWTSYPGDGQGPGQGAALDAQQNPFAAMRDDPTRNFAYLMDTLAKYMA